MNQTGSAPKRGLDINENGRDAKKIRIEETEDGISMSRCDGDEEVCDFSENEELPRKKIIKLTHLKAIYNTPILTTNRYEVVVDEYHLACYGVVQGFNRAIEEIIEYTVNHGDSKNERVGLKFGFDGVDQCTDRYWIVIPYHEIVGNGLDYISSRLENVFQSGDKFTFNRFLVDISIVTRKGGHSVTPATLNFKNKKLYKKHLANGEKGCGFISAVLALKFKDGKKTDQMWLSTIEKEARLLAQECGLDYDCFMGPEEFKKIEELKKLRFIIFGLDKDSNNATQIIYRSMNVDRTWPLIILGLDGTSYFPIRRITELYERRGPRGYGTYHNLCEGCLEFVPNLLKHGADCPMICGQCKSGECLSQAGEQKTCQECGRLFYNIKCYAYHKKNNTCKKYKICKGCGVLETLNSNGEYKHKCDEITCNTCYKSYKTDGTVHTCYMSSSKPKNASCLTIYYDIESYKDPSTNEHIPYLLVSSLVCSNCPPTKENRSCETESCETKIFKKNTEANPVNEFIEYLIKLSEKKRKKIYVLSHNNSSFDGKFVYRVALEHCSSTLFTGDPIKRGNKIIQMEFLQNVIFKDTLLYAPCKLSALPKVMGVDTEVSKGFFPYTFLTPDTLNYVGPPPSRKYFNTEKMTSAELKEFDEYYAPFSEGKPYDIMQECLKYCITDVVVLKTCFEKFRKIYIARFDTDPIQSAATIASLCFSVFTNFFIPEKTLAVIRRNTVRNYSYKAIRWIMYESQRIGISVKHARNTGEVPLKIRGRVFWVDGYYDHPETGAKVILSFHGCYWHGCDKVECREKIRKGTIGIETMDDRLTHTKTRDALIEAEGIEHHIIWEHEYDAKISQNTDGFADSIKRINQNFDVSPLVCGQSLFGGRTNPFRLYVPPEKGQKIHYFDFCSLYPYVMKSNPYPVGPPPSIENFSLHLNDKYFGLSRVDVLPPQDLWMPVLPVSINKKLFFPLCVTRAAQNIGQCTHNERQRMIQGVYTSPELALALEHGYRILKIYEVWRLKKHDSLFTGYINTFLKDKVEASGYPRGVESDTEKLEYIKNFEAREGVTLDKDLIAKNPGRRFIAKLSLNSLWGRFAMNTGRGNIHLATSYNDVWGYVNDSSKEVTYIDYVGDTFILRYNKLSEVDDHSRVLNIPVASFTTAYARVKLYRLLQSLGKRVLYGDTDSVIFTAREGESMPVLGSYLGDLTDEIKDAFGNEAFADSFVSSGPKTYGIRVNNGSGNYKYIVKAKGITLSSENKDKINFDSLVDLVSIPNDKECPDSSKKIMASTFNLRATNRGVVHEIHGEKQCRLTYSKRHITPGTYDTRPFGYTGN